MSDEQEYIATFKCQWNIDSDKIIEALKVGFRLDEWQHKIKITAKSFANVEGFENEMIDQIHEQFSMYEHMLIGRLFPELISIEKYSDSHIIEEFKKTNENQTD